jgi:hypothetical protein
MLEFSFFQFLSCTKRLSLVAPPEEEYGRPESGDRPTDKDWLQGLAANFLDEGIKMFIPRHEKSALICVATTRKCSLRLQSRSGALKNCCVTLGGEGVKTKENEDAGYEGGRCFMTLDVGKKNTVLKYIRHWNV